MKKILFLSFIVLMFCACKHQQSNVSSDDPSNFYSPLSDLEIRELMTTISTSSNCYVSPVRPQIGSNNTPVAYRLTVLTEEGNLNTCISNIPKFLDTYKFSLSEKDNSYTPVSSIDKKAHFQEFTCQSDKKYDRIHVLRNDTDLWIETATSLTCSSFSLDNVEWWYTRATDKSAANCRRYKKSN